MCRGSVASHSGARDGTSTLFGNSRVSYCKTASRGAEQALPRRRSAAGRFYVGLTASTTCEHLRPVTLDRDGPPLYVIANNAVRERVTYMKIRLLLLACAAMVFSSITM